MNGLSGLTRFFSSEESNIASPQQTSPLGKAKEQTSGKLYLNQTCIVPLDGSAGAQKGLLICAPLQSNGDEALKECYRLIFQQALGNDVQTLLVPTFSTGDGGYNHKKAALIAIEEATLFYQNNPNANIDIWFVVYQNQDGTICDQQNIDAYQEALNQINQQFPDGLPQRLSCLISQIQFLPAEMVVIPVGVHFETTGAVYTAIENASKQSTPEKGTLRAIQPKVEATSGECPSEAKFPELETGSSTALAPASEQDWSDILNGDPFQHILPHLDTEMVGNLLLVSKGFQDAVKRSSGLKTWHSEYFGKLDVSVWGGSLFDHFSIPPVALTENGLALVVDRADILRGKTCGRLVSMQPIEKCLSDFVRHIPIQQKWIKTAALVSKFPTFFAIGKTQDSYKLHCSADSGNVISKHPGIFKRYCENKDYAKQLNLALTYDAFGYGAVVSETEIQALKAANISQKDNCSDPVFVYEQLSPLQIISMHILKTFYIPAFFSAYTKALNLDDPGCPVQKYDGENFTEGCNVVFRIELEESAQVGTISDQEILFSCYSQFEYQGSGIVENGQVAGMTVDTSMNGLFVVLLKTTKGEESSLPDGFDQWAIRQVMFLRKNNIKSITLGGLVEDFKRRAERKGLVSYPKK